ncbi:hypothetical protein M0R45_021827 [Rubus argutus]|uniref:Reticulon-like protein n=1 Tax=Rubus argutus TaxID=59490 RepID=A0AAW1XDG3_RUBAR
MSTHTPLHAILGGGKVADIMLWKDKKLAAAILLAFTTIWLLLQCKVAGRINRRPPEINIQLPQSTWIYLFETINWFLLKFCEIISGKNFELFFVAMAGLYILSAIGTHVSFFSLFYIAILSVETLPALYAQYETQLGTIAARCIRDVKKLCKLFQSNVLDKIPRHMKLN